MTERDHIPGTLVLLIGMGLLLAVTIWMAIQRSVRVDEPSITGPARAREMLPDMRIDLNSASAAELGLLPAIGPELAQRIIDDRAQHGPFKDVNDLSRVPGIGPATIDRLRAYVVAYAIDASPATSAGGDPSADH